jgi:hypothetical protein
MAEGERVDSRDGARAGQSASQPGWSAGAAQVAMPAELTATDLRAVGKIYTDRALIPGWEIKNPYIKALLKLERLLL